MPGPGEDLTLPSKEELLRTAGEGGDLQGRTLLAALLVASTRPGAVLDVGCKSGWLLAHLASTTDAGVLVGLDRDATLLPRSSARIRSLVGDATRLPVVERGFDAVTMFEVIEHLPAGTEPAALAEAARALRPGGLLFLSTPAHWLPGTLLDPAHWLSGHRHYPRARLLDMVRAAGLEPVVHEVRGGWNEVLCLPLRYTSNRLGLPMPAGSWFRRWANRAYARPGRYTHFVVARRP